MCEQDVFRQFVFWNCPPGTAVPKLIWNPFVEEDQLMQAERLEKLVNVGLDVPKAWAQEQAGVPEAKEGEDLLKRKKVVVPGFPGQPQPEEPDEEDEEEPEDEVDEEDEMASKQAKAPTLEDLFQLEAAEADDTHAVAFAGETLATILTGMADAVESAEGKGQGERSQG
jgi:phage gp29-like protein